MGLSGSVVGVFLGAATVVILRAALVWFAEVFPPKRFMCTCGNCKWNDFVWLIVDGAEVKEFKCGRRFRYDANHVLVEQKNDETEENATQASL